jgi:hypothetical protein
MGAYAKRPWWPAVSTTVLAAFAFGALRGVETEASAGTQQCNTECQSKMTDCILACDGMRSCEEACKKKGQSCVAACSSDAGPPLDSADGNADATFDGGIFDARGTTAAKDAAPRPARDR